MLHIVKLSGGHHPSQVADVGEGSVLSVFPVMMMLEGNCTGNKSMALLKCDLVLSGVFISCFQIFVYEMTNAAY